MRYQYRCRKCNREHEWNHPMKWDAYTWCWHCEQQTLEKVIMPSAVIFNGEGWIDKMRKFDTLNNKPRKRKQKEE